MNITLRDILSDLHAAERELQSYEKKYGLRSDFFYDCFHAGLTEDAGNFDFQVWAGLVEAKRDLGTILRNIPTIRNCNLPILITSTSLRT